MTKINLSRAIMVMTGVMAIVWIAIVIALYCQWMNKTSILKVLIVSNLALIVLFSFIGDLVLNINLDELLSDTTDIWDNKLTTIISYVCVTICALFILWIVCEGFIDWLSPSEKDEWFGLFIAFRLAIVFDTVYYLVFRMESLWLLEQRDK